VTDFSYVYLFVCYGCGFNKLCLKQVNETMEQLRVVAELATAHFMRKQVKSTGETGFVISIC
jgi:hypothetical protein